MKKVVFQLIRVFGVYRLFYFLNRKAKRVLVFHNVMPDAMVEKYGNIGACISLTEFENMISCVSRRMGFSNDFSDPTTAAITFDDGYRNQYEIAFKRLHEKLIPACLFVSGDAKETLAIDRILLWNERAPIACIPDGDRKRHWAEVLWPEYISDGMQKGVNLLSRLDSIYPFQQLFAEMNQEFVALRFDGIMENELDEMRRAGWLVGWHTKTHSPLARLTGKDKQKEMMPPEKLRGVAMSYPYGNDDLVDDETINLAADYGFPVAFSNTHSSARNVSPYFAPRMTLWGSDQDHVDLELSGLRYFLQYRRLLPRVNLARA